MPFPERIRQIEIEKSTNCGVCDNPFAPNEVVEVHSITSLHLVYKDGKYVVTDPTAGHEALRGKAISSGVYSPEETKDSDGICLCGQCHDEIHRIALAEARLDQNFIGNAPSPKMLEDVTLFFVNRKKPIIYENVGQKDKKTIEIIFFERPKVIFIETQSAGLI
jgi:hypothetical protein